MGCSFTLPSLDPLRNLIGRAGCPCRPLSRVLSWLWPTAEIVATDKNTLYPEIQEEWDQGVGHSRDVQ